MPSAPTAPTDASVNASASRAAQVDDEEVEMPASFIPIEYVSAEQY
jgi:hypothetical protein